MKTTLLALFLTCLGVWAQTPPSPAAPGAPTNAAINPGGGAPPGGPFGPAPGAPTAGISTNRARLMEALRQLQQSKSNAVINAALTSPAGAVAAAVVSNTPAGSSNSAARSLARPILPPPGSNSIIVPTSSPATATPSGALPGANPSGTPTQPGEQVIAIPPPPQASNAPPEEMLPAGTINFPATDLNQVLQIYAELVNRTVLRPTTLAAPTITLKTQTPLTKKEAIQAFDAVLAMNGIVTINIGDKFVKVQNEAQAGQAGGPWSKVPADKFPDLGPYVTHVVQLKYTKPGEVVQILQPYAKVPNGIQPVESSQILVLRDYTENVKRMLELLKEIDIPMQSEFISEVIPIKYALASDISSALSSLGGGGGGGTTVGSSARGTPGGIPGGTRTPGSSYPGSYNRPGMSYPGSSTMPGTMGQPGTMGTMGTMGQPGTQPGAVGSSFTDRLQRIIQRASAGGSGDFQIIGPNKIIADERTNSLLVFASRPDMEMIKEIIGKLDVVLAQVLIEAIIMEVSLDNSKSLGVSYLEKQPHGFGNFTGIGAINNTKGFFNTGLFNGLTNAAGGLGSGFSYLASFGNDLDVTIQAIAQDNRVNVLSRPRVQTSHAVPANLFIGNTVPYITGTTFGDFAGVSSRSVYQEKSVGITLQVLPLINPDGLVVMDIQQDIEQLGTPTVIDGNPVPTTTKRSANAKVAVKDRDTVMLGGFISSSKTLSKSGVPFLKDIPGLGYLFRSTSDSNQRVELIVLLRPTVLPTPEAAAAVATAERNNLGGVRRAEQEIRADEAKRLKQAERESRRQ